MSNTVVLVLGAAGAGKSTFINNVVKRSVTEVSTLRSVDGREKVSGPYKSDNGLVLYDTVGLNSKNHVNSINELSSELHGKGHVSIVLVCRKSEPRWTTWMTSFFDFLALLVDGQPKVVVYWAGAEALTEDAKDEMNENMSAPYHFDDATRNSSTFPEEIKSHLAGNRHNLLNTSSPAVIRSKGPAKAKPKTSMLRCFAHTILVGGGNNVARNGQAYLVDMLKNSTPNDPTAVRKGKILLDFILTVAAEMDNIKDIEHALAHATASLADVYKQLVSDCTSNEPTQYFCNLLYSTAWQLYSKHSKHSNRAFRYLVETLKRDLYESQRKIF